MLDVPTSDPDDARRRRLLNILLLGVFIAALVGLISIILNRIRAQASASDTEIQVLLGGIAIITGGIVLIYQLNRRVSGRWAALLFLLLLTAIFVFTDSPQ